MRKGALAILLASILAAFVASEKVLDSLIVISFTFISGFALATFVWKVLYA